MRIEKVEENSCVFDPERRGWGGCIDNEKKKNYQKCSSQEKANRPSARGVVSDLVPPCNGRQGEKAAYTKVNEDKRRIPKGKQMEDKQCREREKGWAHREQGCREKGGGERGDRGQLTLFFHLEVRPQPRARIRVWYKPLKLLLVWYLGLLHHPSQKYKTLKYKDPAEG